MIVKFNSKKINELVFDCEKRLIQYKVRKLNVELNAIIDDQFNFIDIMGIKYDKRNLSKWFGFFKMMFVMPKM